jgi:phosphoadenosine phosphosulfate reductase
MASAVFTTEDVADANRALVDASAEEIVRWAFANFGTGLVLSTSFGMNAAATLSVSHKVAPEVPVIWVDTGYLPAETHAFADNLTSILGLDVRKYSPTMSPAEMEDRYGKLWEMESAQASKLYDMLRKVEPMVRSVREMNVTAVIAGVQRAQIPTGRTVQIITVQNGIFKVCPFVNWEQSDVDAYLKDNGLEHHPLTGLYHTIGDFHSMKPVPPKPPTLAKTCTDKAVTTQTGSPHDLVLLLIAVLGGLLALWRAYIAPKVSATESPMVQIPTPKITSQPLEALDRGTEALDTVQESSSYATVSGATGAMLLKELQSELQGGVESRGKETEREAARVLVGQKEFWENVGTPSKKTHSRRPASDPVAPSKNANVNTYLNSFTVSGVGGLHLAAELRRVLHRREVCTTWNERRALRHLLA